jgi:SAM-dependent methyltransferase
MTLEKGRYLDIGGCSATLTPILAKEAKLNPHNIYVIADLREIQVAHEPLPNLEYVRAEYRKPSLPFMSLFPNYRLPFPDDEFQGARMDMVLDFLVDPFLRRKVIKEVRRVLLPGGMFNIVDTYQNLSRIKKTCKRAGMAEVSLIDYEELISSDYLMSPCSLGFLEAGFRLFRLVVCK